MRSKLLLLCLLSGCATTSVLPTTEPNTPVAVPIAQPMTLRTVQWRAMSPTQLRELASKLQNAQDDRVVFVLDATNYNNLSLNLAEIERYIREQKTILDMLKGIIAERANSNVQDK